jgi:NTE family protein
MKWSIPIRIQSDGAWSKSGVDIVKRALVLAGGGVAGIAWELGVFRGIGEIDPDLLSSLRNADVVIGTSAGSAVAAQITTGAPIDDLYSAQLSEHSSELEVELNLEEFMGRFVTAATGATGPADMRRRIGALALETPTVSEPIRRAAISARLPMKSWPASTLLVTAVDAETGEPTVFTKDSGVDLVDAVAASCAVPGVWPPVTIDGHRYIDGGVRSGTNADLAAGCDRVLVVTPSQATAPQPWGNLDDEIDQLSPADVKVVYADDASIAAFGTNPLSPSTRGPAAREGRQIGRAEADGVGLFWR